MPEFPLDPTKGGGSIEIEGDIFELAAEDFVTLPDGYIYKDASDEDGKTAFKIKNYNGGQDWFLKLSRVDIGEIMLQDGLMISLNFGEDQHVLYKLEDYGLKHLWSFDSKKDYQEALDLFDEPFDSFSVEKMSGTYMVKDQKASISASLSALFQFPAETLVNWSELDMVLIVDQAMIEIPAGDLQADKKGVVKYKNKILGVQKLVIKEQAPGIYRLEAKLLKKDLDFAPHGDSLLVLLALKDTVGGAFIYPEQKIKISYR